MNPASRIEHVQADRGQAFSGFVNSWRTLPHCPTDGVGDIKSGFVDVSDGERTTEQRPYRSGGQRQRVPVAHADGRVSGPNWRAVATDGALPVGRVGPPSRMQAGPWCRAGVLGGSPRGNQAYVADCLR